MKKILLASAVAVALSMGACATSAPPAPPITGHQTVLDERALFAAEAAYNVAANAYLAAGQTNVLPEARRAQAKAALEQAYQALLLARSAYAVSDAATFGAQILAFNRAVSGATQM